MTGKSFSLAEDNSISGVAMTLDSVLGYRQKEMPGYLSGAKQRFRGCI